MTSHHLILASALAATASGLPAALLGHQRNAGQVVSCLMLVAANVTGLFAIYRWCIDGPSAPLVIPAPMDGLTLSLSIDGLSACFLLPLMVLIGIASIYGLEYWRQSEKPDSGRQVSTFLGLLSGGMTLLVVARDGLVFLVGWEVMAVSAFFLVATEDHIDETRRAAWLYIAASHFATLCLFGVFGLLFAINGSFEFAPLRNSGSPIAAGLALLALLGFGTKAGIMPVHFWLPSAHAQAPSHVSAVMSGMLIKMGIYGLVRVTTFFPDVPIGWGAFVLALGAISAVLGVAFAISQHDIKRLLAYHSIENIGIIVMGLGLALLGRSMHRPDWMVLGIAGAILHVWNHATFKALLFFSAGSVIHSTHTREIDYLGGLQRTMPATAFFFLVGAVAICGLPPLNGFVSELLIYLGLFRTLGLEGGVSFPSAAFAAPALALVGALAVACFVKVYGAVFLGAARSEHARHGHEAGPAMIGSMAGLGACCAFIGIAPLVVTPLLQRGIDEWVGGPNGAASELADLAPLMWISISAGVLIALVGLTWCVLRWRMWAGGSTTSLTWDCGYAAPSSRMQYTSSSFAQMLVGLFRWALWPVVDAPRIRELFPVTPQFRSHTPDPVLDRIVLPFVGGLYRVFYVFRYLQQGNIQAYLLYILIVLVILLVWH